MRAKSLHKLTVLMFVFVLVAGVLLADTAVAADAPDVAWTRQFGTSFSDRGFAVAVDASGVYVAGDTQGALPGQISAGGYDGFVRKHNAAGGEEWTRQFGTASSDTRYTVAADGSGVYVAGSTGGSLPGQSSAGGLDAFVRKYDPEGNEEWTRQFGTASADVGTAIAVDGGGVYVLGSTYGAFPGQTRGGEEDGFVRKYDPEGNEVWTRQFGTSGYDTSFGIAVHGLGVYITGQRDDVSVGGVPAGRGGVFVSAYDTAGKEGWTRDFGTDSADWGYGVAADGSGVYVVGRTAGELPGQTRSGPQDAFVRKYDAAGVEQWTRQFGTGGIDWSAGVAVGASGIYVTGNTGGSLPGQTNAGLRDGFVRKYDETGSELWTDQFGSSGRDWGEAVAVGASGIYVAGESDGALPGQTNAGRDDVFVRRYGARVSQCMGWAVTIEGTDAGETLEGTPGNDVIDAGGGDDVVYGGGGNDIICGRAGSDLLYGGAGNDRLFDAKGANVFRGGDGDDDIRAGGQSSEVYGEAGDDTVRTWAAQGYIDGGAGNDDLAGSYHGETFIGGQGHDSIRPHDGANEVHGGPGNDTVRVERATSDQYVDGGSGDDFIRTDQGNDTLIGGDGNDAIYGFWGDDTIAGGPGHDTLFGQEGDDTIHGGDGNDFITGWGGRDSLWGDGGNDTIQSGVDVDIVGGGDGDDHLVSGLGDDVLYGGPGDDELNGRGGADKLRGGEGNDLLRGGPGNDLLWGEAGNDDLRGANGTDTLWGGAGEDVLRGHAMNDALHGQGDDDLIYGGTGDDQLDGGDGTDSLNGGNNTDECTNGEAYESCELIL